MKLNKRIFRFLNDEINYRDDRIDELKRTVGDLQDELWRVRNAEPKPALTLGELRQLIEDPHTRKIQSIKTVRAATRAGLKESKDFVESLPVPNLTFTREELEHLSRLTHCHITGPDTGPRGVFNQISDKIQAVLPAHFKPEPFTVVGDYHLFLEEKN